MAPLPLAWMLVVEARFKAPAAFTLMAATLSARALLVAVRLPLRLMSNPLLVASLIVPLVEIGPTLKTPRVRVRSTEPVGLKLPPVWLKSVVTTMAPEPPRLPADRLSLSAVSDPVAVWVPPANTTRLPVNAAPL